MNNTSYAPAPPAEDPPPNAAIPHAQQHNAQAAAAQLALMQQLQQPQEQQPIVPTYTPSSNIFNQAAAVSVANTTAMNMNIQQQQTQSNNPPPPSPNLSTTTTPQQQQQQSTQSFPCTICKYPNCDIQIVGCNCLLHVRCCPIPIRSCPNPQCFNSSLNQQQNTVACQLELLPMEFAELDEARRQSDIASKATAKAKEKSRARKKAKLDNQGGSSIMSASGIVDAMMNDTPPQQQAPNSSDLRTGRWTTEETAYCDKLIQKFMAGRLPLPEGIKLNEFLSNMLKSKQSRLTKKMKNAKLSSKTFKRTTGYLTDAIEGSEFSESENAFFNSLNDTLDRSEIKFHMQKEWRETFSTYCVSYGQPLNVDRWLESVEEMERRVNRAKDAERSIRRNMMMGNAMRQDLQNPDRGVVIVNDKPSPQQQQHQQQQSTNGQMFHNPNANVSSTPMMMHNNLMQPTNATTIDDDNAQSQSMGSPFLHRIMLYIQRNHIPFEYIDAWVPSFVPDASAAETAPSESSSVAGSDTGKQIEEKTKCRLCFAGSTVAKQVIVGDIAAGQARRAVPMSADEQFNLSAFGDYSESFSFDVGCGLPGRVYHMGVPTWEQSVHNAPLHHFERVGGAQQWGIKTVVGIPVPSPNVGRVVVVLYSRHDRSKDHDLVIRLTEEFSRLLPSPKWKLIVDIGRPPQTAAQQQAQKALSPENAAALTSEVISIFGEHMPSDQNDPAFAYLQGFMSLRLLLLRPSRSETEQDVVNTILSSYSSYKDGGRTRPDIALMLARDFIFLQESKQQTRQQPVQVHQPIQQQQQFVQQQSYTTAQSQMPPPASPFGLAAASAMQQQQQQPVQQYQQVNQEQYQNSTEDHDAIAASLLGELGATDMVDLVVNNGDEQQQQMTTT